MEAGGPERLVREIMTDFAERTGLSSEGKSPRRYLWTDAFAVCNFLELFRRSGEVRWRELALRLVHQVHSILGRHRPDDRRKGWISGLDEAEAERHPTIGGLRIGKSMNERGAGEPFDESLEWERDGQYFHYLTKWMHALCRVARITGESVYSVWAMELAKTAHGRFVYSSPTGRKRMAWKMSIDLSRPLVPSMGQHDPLDGLVTFRQLQQSAQVDFGGPGPELSLEIEEMEEMCRMTSGSTDDPLGIGGLLFDAGRTAQWMLRGGSDDSGLLEKILESALSGLQSGTALHFMALPADYRLAFRELGLAIGLKGVESMHEWVEQRPKIFAGGAPDLIARLRKDAGSWERIEKFWIEETHRKAESWTEHRDINAVMLATSLAPQSFLSI